MSARGVPLVWALVPVAMLLGTAVALTATHVALVGDGSYCLVVLLGDGELCGQGGRVLGNAVRHGPVLAAAAAGITDTRDHSLLLGLGQLVLPAVAWSLALLLARAERTAFAIVALIGCLCAGTTWFNSVSESVLAVALTVLLAVLLWKPRAWRVRDAALAVAVAVVLLASYETAVLTGAVAGIWALLRARSAASRLDALCSYAVAFLSFASVPVALFATGEGPGPTHAQSFVYFVASLDPWPLYVALAGAVSIVVGIGAPLPTAVRWTALIAGCLAAVTVATELDATSGGAFKARGGAVAAGLVAELVLLALWIGTRRGRNAPEAPPAGRPWGLVPLLAFVVLVSIPNFQAIRPWRDGLDAFRATVASTQGVVDAEGVLPPEADVVLWGWTSPSLSLVVRPRPDAGVLSDRAPSFVPFPPENAREQLPDRYVWRGAEVGGR